MADYPLLYNGQSNFVDLASVPVGMVERIDVAPGNQSSIYGSSAIAGVVNIILKKRMDGMQMNYRMGTYDGGGGNNQRFQLTGGNAIGGANIVWGLQLNNQDPIYGFQRRNFDSTNDNPDPTLRYGSQVALHSIPGPRTAISTRAQTIALRWARCSTTRSRSTTAPSAATTAAAAARSATQAFSTRSAVRAVTPT